jgi:peptidoglycan/xylan/chitin deacetylase (PgdA/CDA1 family)
MINKKRHLRVITYHRIAELNQKSGGNPQLISATPSDFERQVAYLTKRYNVVSAKQVMESAVIGAPLPQKAVLITFDDAYCDFKTNAWPILKKFGLPATIFVPTAYPDNPDKLFWWDKLHLSIMSSTKQCLFLSPIGLLLLTDRVTRSRSLRKLQNYIKSLPYIKAMALVDEICANVGRSEFSNNNVLGWDELRKLSREGVELGAHTQTHPILDKLPVNQIREEAVGSYLDLKREIGDVLPIISYPNGNCNAKILKIMQQEGFKLGFTTNDGHNYLGLINPLMLRRTNITLKTSPKIFQLRLMRFFPYVDRLRHRDYRAFNERIC